MQDESMGDLLERRWLWSHRDIDLQRTRRRTGGIVVYSSQRKPSVGNMEKRGVPYMTGSL